MPTFYLYCINRCRQSQWPHQLGQLARNWINVYAGNLAGALFFVALMWFAGQHMVANGAWGLNVLQTADHKMHHTFIEAVCLGTLANLLVCLAVWMSYSGRTLTNSWS